MERIEEFASENDADKYSTIVYSASGLLNGEDAVDPVPEGTAVKSRRRRILTTPVPFRPVLKK